MTNEAARKAADAEVRAAIAAAGDIAQGLPSACKAPEIIALAGLILDAYHWHRRSTPLIPGVQAVVSREFPHE